MKFPSASPSRRRLTCAAGVAAAGGAAAWWFSDKAPYPYAQRGLLDLPLPFLTSERLDAVLAPRAGERILEVGPGTGLQALHIAPQLGPGGQLDVLDIQMRAAPCRSSQRPCAAVNSGPAVRAPMARSIARAVRGASGMVTTFPPCG
jgi:hypothetical protein